MGASEGAVEFLIPFHKYPCWENPQTADIICMDVYLGYQNPTEE